MSSQFSFVSIYSIPLIFPSAKKKDLCLVFIIGYKQSQVICNFKENRKGTGVGDVENIQHAPEMMRHANVGRA